MNLSLHYYDTNTKYDNHTKGAKIHSYNIRTSCTLNGTLIPHCHHH